MLLLCRTNRTEHPTLRNVAYSHKAEWSLFCSSWMYTKTSDLQSNPIQDCYRGGYSKRPSWTLVIRCVCLCDCIYRRPRSILINGVKDIMFCPKLGFYYVEDGYRFLSLSTLSANLRSTILANITPRHQNSFRILSIENEQIINEISKYVFCAFKLRN